MRARPIPRAIGLLFGALWGLIGALALPRPAQALAVACVALIAIGLLGRLWFRASMGGEGNSLFRRRAYLLAVIFEVGAIMLASSLMPRLGLGDYFLCAVGVVVGLHFIGLWRANGEVRFVHIALAMCMVSIVATLLPLAGRDALLGFGNALVLWIGAGLP